MGTRAEDLFAVAAKDREELLALVMNIIEELDGQERGHRKRIREAVEATLNEIAKRKREAS